MLSFLKMTSKQNNKDDEVWASRTIYDETNMWREASEWSSMTTTMVQLIG